MDRNLARSSNRLPGISRCGALTDFTTRHSFTRWEVIGRNRIRYRSFRRGNGLTAFCAQRLSLKLNEPSNFIRRFRPDTSARAQTFQQSAIVDSQHSKPVIADFSHSKKGVDFIKKICAHKAPIHAIACTCNTRNYVHTFFRARGIN